MGRSVLLVIFCWSSSPLRRCICHFFQLRVFVFSSVLRAQSPSPSVFAPSGTNCVCNILPFPSVHPSVCCTNGARYLFPYHRSVQYTNCACYKYRTPFVRTIFLNTSHVLLLISSVRPSVALMVLPVFSFPSVTCMGQFRVQAILIGSAIVGPSSLTVLL